MVHIGLRYYRGRERRYCGDVYEEMNPHPDRWVQTLLLSDPRPNRLGRAWFAIKAQCARLIGRIQGLING